MSRNLVLAVVITAAVGLVGAALVAAIGASREAPRGAPPAAQSRPRDDGPATPTPGVTLKPRKGRVLAVADAVKELDLIRPSRRKFAEDFMLPLVEGPKFRLADQRGKVVMINFWATWCPPCREEMPAMERLWRHQKDQGFVLVAVSLDADPAVVKPFVDQYKLTFPVALDPKMDLGNAYGIRALPSSFVVDRQGYLATLALGPRAWDNDAAHSLVEGLLR